MTSPDLTPGLVIYVSASCPFCWRVKSLFSSLGLVPEYIDANEFPDRYKEAAAKANHFTLPLVLQGDKTVGGCDDCCLEAASGKLQRRFNMRSYDTVPNAERRPIPNIGLLNMPAIVNRWVVQCTGLLVVLGCCLVIGFRNHSWARWLCFGMCIDFIIRTIFGGLPSIFGSIANLVTFWLDEELVPAAPKQFASAIGIFMSGFATILLFNDQIIGGCVILGVLAGFAALEGFFNFCFGCYIYAWLNVFGLVPFDVYKPYTDSLGFVIAGINDLNTRLGWKEESEFTADSQPGKTGEGKGWRERMAAGSALPRPVSVRVAVDDAQPPGPLDYSYKCPKTDDITREKWSAAYLQFSDFGIVLGIAGFALASRAATENKRFYVQPEFYQFFAIMGASIFGLMLLAKLYRLFRYPGKVVLDLRDPGKRNAAAMIPICFLVFSGLARSHEKWLMSAMWWAGAPLMLAHLVITVGSLIKNRHAQDNLTPSLMFPAAGCLVVAVVTPAMAAAQPWTGDSFKEVAYWYFGIGFLFFITLLATTMFHGFQYHWSDERMRPVSFMWAGACFITVLAYLNVNNITKFDTFCFVFFSSGVALILVNVYLGLMGWLVQGRFDMSMWALAFPLDVAATAGERYFNSQQNDFSQGIFWMLIVLAGWANFVLLQHTLYALVKKRFPTPPTPFGPLAFNKLQHDAFREVLFLLREEVEAVEAENESKDDNSAEAKLERLRSLLAPFLMCQDSHAAYEDTVMFPELASLWPGQITNLTAEHHEIHEREEVVKKNLQSGNLEALLRDLKPFIELTLIHMQQEEDHVAPMIRKHINSTMQINLLQRIWSALTLTELETIIVTTVRFLPFHGKRVRYLKSLLWAMPERAQQIGLWLNRGLAKDPLGDIKLAYILDALPELAPRNSGFKWIRYV